MKIYPRQRTFFLLLIAILLSMQAHSQKLIESRQSSYYSYIYKLADKEAKKIYKNDLDKIEPSLFHTLVDYFPTDSQYVDNLTKGHYLKTFADKNQQRFSITTVQDFDVFVLNNNNDLCVQVYDLHGNIIQNATVNIGIKRLHFDKKTQSYIDQKTNRKGLLKVRVNDFTAYHNLARQYNNSGIKRTTQMIVYNAPVKYVWLPVRYVVKLPVDGVKSIVKGYPQGVIYHTNFFFKRTFRKVASVFDDSYRDRYYKGYIVFNKPKYHVGDTVKFKAFVVTKKGKPVNESVDVVLHGKKRIELEKLNPYNEGGYAGELFLHDSLQLQLDRSYQLSLEINRRERLISGNFRYEDYELSKTKLSLRLDNSKQYKNHAVKMFVKGTDENDLNLLDARIQVLAKSDKISKYFDNHVFIPDTLSYFEKKLEPAGETEVLVPDSLFPKANFDYELIVRLLTSDNEAISESKSVNYFYDSEKFDIDVQTDSILFRFNKNGLSAPVSVRVTANDNFGNKTEVFYGSTPCKVELEPFFASYTVTSDSLSKTINISSKSSLFQCYSERTADSVFIIAENPRKIPFVYTVYKKNNEQSRGYSDSLNIAKKITTKQNYFVSVRYLWGGKIQEQTYRIPFNDRKLNISVKQPKIVYPGQKSKIDILVTDVEGKPVEGVDLTAYSLTRKFNYSPPVLPDFMKNRGNKAVINNFHFEDFNFKTGGFNLDYETWELLAGLDSIEYYRFIYPGNSVYRFEYPALDSLTQFAPFVVSKGEILPIHVIYVDNNPVYFSWSNFTQPYSFKVNSGYHQVKLRTSFKSITIDSLYFSHGKKLIFSLNDDFKAANVHIRDGKPELSEFEQRLLYRYIFPYRNNFGEKYAYLYQNGDAQFLKPELKREHNFAGPVIGNLSFNEIDGFTTHFNHEPFFEYEFTPGLLKMRSINSKEYPRYLKQYQQKHNLADVVLTKDSLYRQWENYLNIKRYSTARYRYPRSTTAGHGELEYSFTKDSKTSTQQPLNMLVFKYDNPEFIRVYPGQISDVHELIEGYYRLLFFYAGAKYQTIDSVFVQPNGLNHYEFKQPPVLEKDSFSISVSKLIEETIFKSAPYYQEEEKELKQIYNHYQQQFQYFGDGEVIEGYVLEEGTGEPIPGVSIVVKGTTYGTISNIDGYFSIKVPRNYHTLVYSFVGFDTEERQIGQDDVSNVSMTASQLGLDEVVVIGYGIQRKSSLTASVSTVSPGLLKGIPGVSGNISQVLQGKLSGVDISYNEKSESTKITIRGSSTVSFDKPPLYIINGNIYNGDISKLDPNLIQNIQVLKDAEATALYGARAANGVVIIETGGSAFKEAPNHGVNGADYDAAFLEAASQASSIRENFSDYAFWQPRLITDKNGKASFDVTFPDDVTSWETFYLAMNGKKQSGQVRDLVKSYKPLMAQLAVPRFLVQSDTTFAIGKALNYSPDSVLITTKFELDDKSVFKKVRYVSNSVLDTIPVVAGVDSLSLKYFLEKEDGYFDGEIRTIPVYPLGLEKTKGSFYVLDKDTSVNLSFDTALGNATVYARADELNVIEDEIIHLKQYRYNCNEQLASKLKALLAEKTIYEFQKKKFEGDNDIEKLIRQLKKDQKENGLWGWWKDSDEKLWISLHVLEALLNAEKSGYQVETDKDKLSGNLIWEFQNTRNLDSGIKILTVLKLLGAQVDYKKYMADLEKTKKPNFNEMLQLMTLKQTCDIHFDTDTLKHYQKSTMFGNIYYGDDSSQSTLLVNNIQNTLLAYRILKTDSVGNASKLGKIRNYFFESRKNGYWQNTFESAQIIETILPDLLGNQPNVVKPVLQIKGDVVKTVTEFPFEMEVTPTQNLDVIKTGSFPVYLTCYQKYWDKAPKVNKSDFEITTHFDDNFSSILKAGEEVSLTAKVKVKHDAQYIMINIPIPGGCSYADKRNYFKNESHREYFKNETAVFCEYLPEGEYSFEVKLIPRYTGNYTLNPAKAELMYFPTFFGNNEVRKVRILK